MALTTSMPRTTWPNAAKPWPSGLRRRANPSRLIGDDDGEGCGRAVGRAASHRDRPVGMRQPGHARAFDRNGRELLAAARGVDLELDVLDLDIVPHGVVRPDRA